MRSIVKLFAASALAWTVAAPVQAQTPPHLDLSLSPHAAGGRVDYVDVRMTLQAPGLQAGRPLMRVIRQIAQIHVDYDVKSFTVTDSQGAVPLTQRDFSAGPATKDREWAVGRATVGDVTVSYRAPARIVTGPLGPHFELRSEAQAVTGAGHGFLASPVDSQPHLVRIRWDLSGMPAGSIGVWSYGEGDDQHLAKPSELGGLYYGAGVFHREAKGPFGFYWASEAPFDAAGTAKWTEATFEAYGVFFRHRPDSYRVFMRRNDYAGGSGAALTESFTFGYAAADPDLGHMKPLLAHEMAHTFITPLAGGDDSTATAWYNEGGAQYYSNVLLMRLGLIDSGVFQKNIEGAFSDYYPRPSRDLSIAQAASDGFFTGNSIQQLAYGRGWLYLAQVNSKLRAASGGKHGLDEITLKINELARQGKPHGPDDWLKMVVAIGGPQMAADHQAFMAGKLLIPPNDAFGPCFRRERVEIGRFDLGFDEKILLPGGNRVVAGLRAGSPGAAAGLQDGDQIVSATPLGGLYGDPKGEMVMKIRRGEQALDTRYVPRSGSIEGYRWVRIPEVPESACRKV